jgi:hypothetical protein
MLDWVLVIMTEMNFMAVLSWENRAEFHKK